jgi:hypothetical protein
MVRLIPKNHGRIPWTADRPERHFFDARQSGLSLLD